MATTALPVAVLDAVEEWLGAHDEAAPGVIEGLYLVGSVALDDWTPHSDIDVVAVVADPSDPDLFDDLAAAHELVRGRTRIPIDGPFVAWGDLVVPPMSLQRPWVLEGEYHVDGESFEINPVTWYTLATYGVAIRGDAPATIGVYADEAERRAFVQENLHSYWRGVGERLAAGIEASTEEHYGSEVLEWVALGVARMFYTWETGDVASKSVAGVWAAGRLPRYAEILGVAVEVRATAGLTTRSQLLDAAAFVEDVVAMVGDG